MKLRFMEPDAELIVPCRVTFTEPGGEAGETVTLQVRVLPASQANAIMLPSREALIERIQSGDPDADPARDLMLATIADWSEADMGLPYSAEALERLASWVFARNQYLAAYRELVSGLPRKN